MLTDEQLKNLDIQGHLIIEDALSTDQVTELKEQSLELAANEREDSGKYVYLDEKSQRVWNLINKGKIFEEVIQHPDVMHGMEHLLDADFVLSSFTVNRIGPGSPAGGLHIDYPLSAMPTPIPTFAISANSVFFLDDFTIENGGTFVIPGSHRWGFGPSHRPDFQPQGKIQATGPAGTIMLVHGHIWHGSAPNQTDADRVGLLGFFCRSFMKPQQDQLKLVDQEIIDNAEPQMRRLLGLDCQPNLND